MKKFFSALTLQLFIGATLLAGGNTPIENAAITGTSFISSGTFSIQTGVVTQFQSGSTTQFLSGSTFDIGSTLTFSATLTPTALSADQNNYNPTGLSTAIAVRIDGGSADRNITGLGGGTNGRIVEITNIGATNLLVLKDQNSSSSPGNQFLFGADVSIGPNKAIVLRYDGTSSRWRAFDRALVNTGVTAGSYGNATHIPSFTVDIQGRLSAASSTLITPTNLAFASWAISSTTIDWSLANSFSKTLSANTTFSFSNATDGQTIVVAITNTASNYTVTWPTVSWTGGSAPVQTIGAHTDVYTFIKIGSTIYGSVIQNF